MKTSRRHTSSLHRHRHPIHWHGSMVLAIAALLLTSFKCSDEMLRAMRAVPIHAAVLENVYMRDAETGHTPIVFNIGLRHATLSGK